MMHRWFHMIVLAIILLAGCLFGAVPSFAGDDIVNSDFMIDPSDIAPTKNKYTDGSEENISKLLSRTGKSLMIGIAVLAIFMIAISGAMIASAGDSDRAQKGKTMLRICVYALLTALFAYSIIELVNWVMGS